MREVLNFHLKKYPKMQLQDMVKLIYQSEFGGGHMIADQAESLERIKKEYAGGGWENDSLVDPAGLGMCRISLKVLSQGLSADTLNSMFVHSAEEIHGSVKGLEQGLVLLNDMCRRRELPFSLEELQSYCEAYREKGYPAVSHSQAYREAYHPSYRIAAAGYGKYLPVFIAIDRLLKQKEEEGSFSPIIISIDGMSGSGKTSLAKLLAGIYPCNVFHMDDFFLQPFQRTKERFEEPGGNVDYERFKEEILDHLGDEGGLEYRVYNCSQQKLDKKVRVPFQKMNIIEGSYSNHPFFGNPYDLMVFLEIDSKEQEKRIRERNGDFLLRRFLTEWIPLENAYFEACKIKEKASLVLTNEGQML